MTRSQLLKDLVMDDTSLENILLRLKVILPDLESDSIMDWINGELQGYTDKTKLPEYRIFKGRLTGDFLLNFYYRYTNADVPIEALLSKEVVEELSKLYITDNITILERITKKGTDVQASKYSKIIPAGYCHSISKDMFQLTSMEVQAPSNLIEGIISRVKSKLVEIIMELEKQFSNLDELDISSQIKDTTQKEETADKLFQIIYDQSINIGDHNKLSKSKLGHLFGGKK